MPLPEEYDYFDPEAYDDEMERMEAEVHVFWLNDLRNLTSEAQARDRDRTPGGGTIDWKKLRADFNASDPEPRISGPPHLRAEWEWRWTEHYLQHTGNEAALTRHRLEKGSFIANEEAGIRRAQENFEQTFPAAFVKGEPPPPHEAEPWPPDIGDPADVWLERLDEDLEEFDPDEWAEKQASMGIPIYAADRRLMAGSMGWFQSLPKEARPMAQVLSQAINNSRKGYRFSHEHEYRPGLIGDDLFALKKALLSAHEALEILEDLQNNWWMSGPAYRALRTLIEDVRDTMIDKYGEATAVYNGYLERAQRILTRAPLDESLGF